MNIRYVYYYIFRVPSFLGMVFLAVFAAASMAQSNCPATQEENCESFFSEECCVCGNPHNLQNPEKQCCMRYQKKCKGMTQEAAKQICTANPFKCSSPKVSEGNPPIIGKPPGGTPPIRPPHDKLRLPHDFNKQLIKDNVLQKQLQR